MLAKTNRLRAGSGKSASRPMYYGTLSFLRPSFLYHPFLLALTFFPFVCLPASGDIPPQIQVGFGEHCELPNLSGRSSANERFLMHYEMKITLPRHSALLQKFSDSPMRAVICTVIATWYVIITYFSEKK